MPPRPAPGSCGAGAGPTSVAALALMSKRYSLPSFAYSKVLASFQVTTSVPGLTAPVISFVIRWYCSYPGIDFSRSWAAIVVPRPKKVTTNATAGRADSPTRFRNDMLMLLEGRHAAAGRGRQPDLVLHLRRNDNLGAG